MAWYFEDISRVISLVIMVMIFVGIALRKNRKLHPKIMLGCFAGDLGLLLYIEFSRSAIETSASEMTPLLAVHIALAMLMLASYGHLTQTGSALLKAKEGIDLAKVRSRHGKVAILFVLLRLSVMITAVYVAHEVGAGDANAS